MTEAIKSNRPSGFRTKSKSGQGHVSPDRRIRIGINGSMLDSRPTGVGVFTYNLVNALHRRIEQAGRYELTVFTPSTQHLEPGIRIYPISPLVQSTDFPKTSAISRLVWNQLAYPIAARKMDILLNPSTHGHLWGQNQILTIHDLLSLRFENISAHQRLYFQQVLPKLIQNSRSIIAVSESTKDDIIHFFGTPAEKIHVVYNGFDSRNFHPSRGSTSVIREWYGMTDYLLAIGPTYPHKNFETLIRAFALLSAELRMRHPLLIAGGRPGYLSTLRNIARESGVAEQIHFVGYVPQHLMPALYQDARMLIFPSLYEGFGIPLIEAMACGCPVVCSHASSMPEVCGSAAVYAEPDSPESIQCGIQSLLNDEHLRKGLIAKGITRARAFSWERAADSVLEIIEDYT